MHGCVGDLALFMFLLLFFVYRSRAWISRCEISVLSVLLKESLMGCVGSEIKLERGRVASLEMMAIFSASSYSCVKALKKLKSSRPKGQLSLSACLSE